MNEKELLEDLAALEHTQWAHWTEYMLSKISYRIVPHGIGCECDDCEDLRRWYKQIKTPYSELTEKEKDSDREWARRVMGVLGEWGFISSDCTVCGACDNCELCGACMEGYPEGTTICDTCTGEIQRGTRPPPKGTLHDLVKLWRLHTYDAGSEAAYAVESCANALERRLEEKK
jgi:hypothetical protein